MRGVTQIIMCEHSNNLNKIGNKESRNVKILYYECNIYSNDY